jgi:hypothetical protein
MKKLLQILLLSSPLWLALESKAIITNPDGSKTYIVYYCAGSRNTICRIDPAGILSYKFDVWFDTSVFSYDSISYPGGFTEDSPPDLTNLSLGKIDDISASSPTPVNGVLADIILSNILPLPFAVNSSNFQVSLSSGDFIRSVDSSGNTVTYDTIGPLPFGYAPCPTPSPIPLLGVGAAFGYSRKLRKRIKTSKTPEVLSVIG